MQCDYWMPAFAGMTSAAPAFLHRYFAATMRAAHTSFSADLIIRKSNRSFGKFLRQRATRQFVLHCNIVSSLRCNMNSAMQHGLIRARN
jgi:hypothetical protein